MITQNNRALGNVLIKVFQGEFAIVTLQHSILSTKIDIDI